jgi:phage shock protein PspC (stress-responsive transcriptional regulator)
MWDEENENKWTKTDFKQYFSNKNEPITRNSEKGIISWVCYGIWERFEVDPLWIRLMFVFGTFLWGATIILYIALIILLPDVDNSKKKIKKKVCKS